MTATRRLALAGTVGAAAFLLGGCVVAPPVYGPYGEAAVVAPPVSVDIGVGGYYGRPYYGRPYYGRPGYYGRGYWGGRPYWR
ncbi:MAG TPA: hypothetical protein VEP93_11460 [Variovorax sp.]|nr:hypothetical protein [Variovorax sp.]